MSPDEVIDLLSIITGYDRRTVGRTDVESWRLALADPRIPNIGYDECVDAVIMHYRETTDFVMPSHILTRVKAQRASTLAHALPASRVDHSAYERVHGIWTQAHHDAQARMATRRAAVLAYPDLARRLTEPPLGFAKPEQWRGNIGPETFGGEYNDSARRAALVELVVEAGRRAAEADA